MFKDKLKEYRKINNITQDELAAKLYISRTLVTKWESGVLYPTKEHSLRLVEIFNVPLKTFFTKREINSIFFQDYKKKFIEKVLSFISMTLIVISITLLIFSFILEDTLTNLSNIVRLVPPTRYVLFSLLIIAIILLIIEFVLSKIFKNKHMYIV